MKSQIRAWTESSRYALRLVPIVAIVYLLCTPFVVLFRIARGSPDTPVAIALAISSLWLLPTLLIGPLLVHRLARELGLLKSTTSTKTKPYLLVVACTLAIAAVSSLVLGTIDLHRARQFRLPTFCYAYEIYLDGGTMEHYGFGYRIRCWQQYTSEGPDQPYDLIVGSDIRWWPFFEEMWSPSSRIAKRYRQGDAPHWIDDSEWRMSHQRALFPSLPEGYTLKDHGSWGYIFFREGENVVAVFFTRDKPSTPMEIYWPYVLTWSNNGMEIPKERQQKIIDGMIDFANTRGIGLVFK